MIDTGRLVLRPFLPSDVAGILVFSTDELVRRFVRNLPTTTEEAWRRILQYAGHWTMFGYGALAVVEKSTDRLIGEVGAGHYARGIGAEFDGLPEVSWLFVKEAQGKGYAKEAATALLNWLEESTDISRFFALVEPANRPSLKLADSIGFNEIEEIEFRCRQFLVLTRHRHDASPAA